MIKDDTSKKRKLPTIDHGVDIIGDEWEDEEDEWVNNEVNTDTLQNEENWEDEADVRPIYADVRPIYNDAQMLNGSFEGDTISQIGKKHQKKEKVEEKSKEKPISDN